MLDEMDYLPVCGRRSPKDAEFSPSLVSYVISFQDARLRIRAALKPQLRSKVDRRIGLQCVPRTLGAWERQATKLCNPVSDTHCFDPIKRDGGWVKEKFRLENPARNVPAEVATEGSTAVLDWSRVYCCML
jgi:hypothetical protein